MIHDIIIVGAGAAGLAAAIFAGERARGRLRILLVDGAKKPGAKILVSGGGRCNVTNETVVPSDYWGGSPVIIRNVLRSFDERQTLAWMKSIGVELKLEPTGKYFPVTDSARTVLDALIARVSEVRVGLRSQVRIKEIAFTSELAELTTASGDMLRARRVIVAMGGAALPKSGSDGAGIAMLRSLGHGIVPITPALVPLTVASDQVELCRELSGVTLDARVIVKDATGRKLHDRVDSLLFTHFGISGPAALNASRHWLREEHDNPGKPAVLTIGAPQFASGDDADAWLMQRGKDNPRRHAANVLSEIFPDRLATSLAGDLPEIGKLTRGQRRTLAEKVHGFTIHVSGSRGFSFAETTAGGVELDEVNFRTMESRRVPRLHICGEILDVDGRIGGFNFQWAWASGHVAGTAAAAALIQ
ncbi:aminoacetone oxidase family FAD-binding enzyme [Candidatus Sumerlaeota bacterium]|nr:aminoacetone oxidase family FAD-binding enzyme [Candidatus Sumerlaeota bacterium]